MVRPAPSAGFESPRLAGWMLIGAAVLVLAQIASFAGLPTPADDAPATVAANEATNAGAVRVAGWLGVGSDVLFVGAALLFLPRATSGGRPLLAAGWALAATGAILFLGVDGFAATALPVVAAAQPSAPALYDVAKAAYDGLFGIGRTVFFAGALAVLLSEGRSSLPSWARWAGAVAAGIASLGGLPVVESSVPIEFLVLAGATTFLVLLLLGVRTARGAGGP